MKEYNRAKKRLVFLILILPFLVFSLGWVGSHLKDVTSRMHATVRLAERIHLEETGEVEGTTDASLAFRATGRESKDLYEEASQIRADFEYGGWFFGGFIGLITGLKLIAVSIWRKRTDYEAGRAGCLACGRCYQYCPIEHQRLKKLKETTGKN
jgi:hypothetical protein